ncbi:bifunctional 3-(3-hydroxy-phenyl)propionate/3-hydroxycinnamic acid hydroxylase MhpA [Rhodococcus erythropolis]|uniref:bifunctional 3-(3-hydroxy-phenyl)propionate/3-hydroxycinnamic acid hydroxylase MhpA n=1 Tax=Rhodococcus erythropolis TaxID=1833 RepID=UPI001BE8652E|nr:bifunctional 3-(3-hydroxy-phenyl)propionate/3-hydroxycinnamic acid hydroxylase [Rhodococcus erythropolis]MBT2268227.1 bifunctional 3-(3-hydroxy-phenyl)propionate/3-hydroxycinnamic acid hydroxylase [Rhodococcus erythropolis]
MQSVNAEATRIAADVMIVGFGPVGKLLAVKLAQKGHAVVVVDRNEVGYPLPRAVTHCADFARILQSVGLAPDTIPEITEPYDDMYVWRNGDGRTLVEVDWSGRGESGWYNTYFFSQPALEGALDSIVAGLPNIRVMRGWEAVALTQNSELATVVVQSVESGRCVTVDARWIVGADGANSRVRQWADIDWHDEGYFHDWLVVDVKPVAGTSFPNVAAQNCDYRRPSTMVPGGPGRRRWEFMRLPEESRESLQREDTAWELLEPYGLTPDNAVLERHSVYTFQACWATRWRRGRVLLAGDSAHLMPPFAGQGLGAGVRDVMNLSWKLDAVLRSAADDHLLDTYGTERLRHARAFVQFSTELGQVICMSDPQQAAERDARMIADWTAGMKAPAPPRPGLGPGIHVGTAGGSLALQGQIRIGDGAVTMFDDAFDGPGALISRTSAALRNVPETMRTALAELGIDLVALVGDESPGVTLVDDVDLTYTRWLDDQDADVVLVRPDFHVYGVAGMHHATELAAGFLRRLRAQEPARTLA